jgi:hypothetical protein
VTQINQEFIAKVAKLLVESGVFANSTTGPDQELFRLVPVPRRKGKNSRLRRYRTWLQSVQSLPEYPGTIGYRENLCLVSLTG